MSIYALKDTDWSWDDADEGRPVIVIADTPEDAVRIATEKHIRDCPGSGGVTWDIARLNLVAFGDAEWGSDNTPNFEPLTYYDEGVNGLPDTPPDASAIREARKFRLGDRVSKIKGSKWTGRVVGFYSTALTPVGYAVESETETGSVQIYPEAALTGAKP